MHLKHLWKIPHRKMLIRHGLVLWSVIVCKKISSMRKGSRMLSANIISADHRKRGVFFSSLEKARELSSDAHSVIIVIVKLLISNICKISLAYLVT